MAKAPEKEVDRERKMAEFQVILTALLSPDNETRNRAEVGREGGGVWSGGTVG